MYLLKKIDNEFPLENTVETWKTEVWLFEFLINWILLEDKLFFFSLALLEPGLFWSLSGSIILIRSWYHPTWHYKSTTCVSLK